MAQAYSSRQTGTHSLVPAVPTDTIIGIAVVITIALISFTALYQETPPDKVAANAPAAVFSSGRAVKQLEQISRNPHPLGSLEHERVGARVVQELVALGLNPTVQKATAVSAEPGNTLHAATVRNIVAELKGVENERAVLLVAHYDTVPNSPGASDDGYGVATLLETLRALKSGPPLKNDVVALFTDGEEVGSLGARAFVDERPYAGDVGVVLNFESRGSKGPVIMFETSPRNSWLIGEFAKAAPHPHANSLASTLYELLPNDTDLTVFKEAKLPGLNFANIDGFMRYHTRADNLEDIEERSLQHQGSYALALTQHFANASFANPRSDDAVYFDLLGVAFVHYPAKWVLAFAMLAAAIFVAVAALGLRKKRLTLAGLALGAVVFILGVVLTWAMVSLLWWLISTLQHWTGRSLQDDFYESKLYYAGFCFICAATTLALYTWSQRKLSLENLIVGGQGCWLILLVLASLLLPGATYLLMWPLVFSSVALAVVFMMREAASASFKRFLVLMLCAAPVIILVAPVLYNVSIAVGLGNAGIVAAMAGIMLGLLVPLCGLVVGLGRWYVPGAASLAGVVLLLVAGLGFNFDGRYPKANNVFYALNADTGKAVWASADAMPDEWTGQFFPAGAERGSITEYAPLYAGSFLNHTAPAIPRQPPQIKMLEDKTDNGVRTLHFSIVPTQAGANVSALVDPKAEVLSATINGKPVVKREPRGGGQPSAPWKLHYWATPADGIDLILEVKAPQPMRVLLVERSDGLPEVPGLSIKPRPEYMIPSSFSASDATLVRKLYSF